MSQPGLSMLWVVPFRSFGEVRPKEARVMITKPRAATSMPRAIFFGAEGSLPFLARAANMAIETGVSATTKKGLNCWKSEGCALTGSGVTKKKIKAAAPQIRSVKIPESILPFLVSDWKVEKRV